MRIVYFTHATFRTHNAGAMRNAGVAKALTITGHDVHIVSPDSPGDVSTDWTSWAEASGVVLDPARDASRNDGLLGRLQRLLVGPAAGLETKLSQIRPDRIIAYNPSAELYRRLHNASRSHEVPLVLDVSEWLKPGDQPGGRATPLAWSYERHMRRLPQAGHSAIVVSRRLHDHFQRNGADVLTVPPLFDKMPGASKQSHDGPTRIVVSGGEIRNGGKDLDSLELMVRALEVGNPRNIRLEVVGSVSDNLRDLYERRLGELVRFHGRIDWARSVELTRESDFLTVLRDPADSRINYGFPSKIPESLLVGTPVIANRFSDVSDHVVDGQNGVIVDRFDESSVAESLDRLDPGLDREAIARTAAKRYTPNSVAAAIDHIVAGAR